MRLHESLQERDRLVGAALAQDLGLEQRRALPVGLERERAVGALERRGGERRVGGPGVERRERHREVRFRRRRVRLGEVADHLVDGDLVLLARERAVELQERVGDAAAAGRLVGEQLLEAALEVVLGGLARRRAAGRERGEDLLRALGVGREARPQPRGALGQRALARRIRDLGRAARELHVVELARDLEVRARGDRRVAALQRDVGEQELVEHLGRQPGRQVGARGGRRTGARRDLRERGPGERHRRGEGGRREPAANEGMRLRMPGHVDHFVEGPGVRS
jgi:hypothetical protein